MLQWIQSCEKFTGLVEIVNPCRGDYNLHYSLHWRTLSTLTLLHNNHCAVPFTELTPFPLRVLYYVCFPYGGCHRSGVLVVSYVNVTKRRTKTDSLTPTEVYQGQRVLTT